MSDHTSYNQRDPPGPLVLSYLDIVENAILWTPLLTPTHVMDMYAPPRYKYPLCTDWYNTVPQKTV